MEGILSYIRLTGTKDVVVKILNAAICNAGTGNIILDGDDIETINHKIKDGKGERLCVEMPDLLDADALKDETVQRKKLDNGDNAPLVRRPIAIEKVEEKNEDFLIDFFLGEYEFEPYTDWLGWPDIVRLYGCKAVVDIENFNDEYDPDTEFYRTHIYEIENGTVKDTVIEPVLDVCEYDDEFEKLIETDHQRYCPRKIRDLREKIAQIQYEIHLEESRLMMDQIESNGGHIVVPDDVTEILDGAFAGCKELKGITFSNSVKKIGRCAFKGCENLSNIVLPQNVEEILDQAFDGCPCEAEMKGRYTEVLDHTHHPYSDEDDKWIKEILGTE